MANVNFPISAETLSREYIKLREQKKLIDARMKELSATLKQQAETFGSKNDSGSYVYDSGRYIVSKVAKKSISFNTEKALSFLKNHGLSDAIVSVETIDESVVEKYVADGTITYADLEDITTSSVSYAVDIQEKEEVVSEVTKSTAIAASNRRRFHAKK